jgi:hypothetical protein
MINADVVPLSPFHLVTKAGTRPGRVVGLLHGRTLIICYCLTIFDRWKPTVFKEFCRSISKGFFVWQMLAIATPRLARARAYISESPSDKSFDRTGHLGDIRSDTRSPHRFDELQAAGAFPPIR